VPPGAHEDSVLLTRLMANQLFPHTRQTWIGDQLASGESGRAEVSRHMMNVYANPLRAYLGATPFRTLGDADEIVQGFLADRLAREGFLTGWQQSDFRLRRWLLNSFRFYLQSYARSSQRQRRSVQLEVDVASPDLDPGQVMDRAFAAELVRRALEATRAECKQLELDEHFELFLDHNVNDVPFRKLAQQHGISMIRARGMTRSARKRFRQHLWKLLARDGASAAQADHEVQSLLEVFSS
jgi:hypothetical protein